MASRCAGLLMVVALAAAEGCTRGRSASVGEIPLGAIDAPVDGAHVTRVLKLQGWAGSNRGVRAIRILVDGKIAALGAFNANRPDVIAVYPRLEHGNNRLGWEASVDLPEPGAHAVQVVAIDIDGVTREIGTLHVNVDAGPSAAKN